MTRSQRSNKDIFGLLAVGRVGTDPKHRGGRGDGGARLDLAERRGVVRAQRERQRSRVAQQHHRTKTDLQRTAAARANRAVSHLRTPPSLKRDIVEYR